VTATTTCEQTDLPDLRLLKTFHKKVTGWYARTTPFPNLLSHITKQDALKSDQIIKRSGLRLTEELTIEGVALTTHALRQVAAIAKVPAPVVSLAELAKGEYKPQLAYIVNTEMAKVGYGDDSCLLRLRKDENGNQVIRAAFGRVPVQFDAIDLLELISDKIKEAGSTISPRFNEAAMDDYRINLFFPDTLFEGRDSKYGRGLQFHISEVGGGTQVRAYTFDTACCNGCVSIHESLSLKIVARDGRVNRTATGDNLLRGMDVLYAAGDDLLTKMGYTYDIPVPEPIKTIAYLIRDLKLTEEEGKHWVDGYVDETIERRRPATTAYTILNGLNRGAQFVDSEVSAQRMEETVARLLSPKPDSTKEELDGFFAKVNAKASRLKEEDYLPYLMTSN